MTIKEIRKIISKGQIEKAIEIMLLMAEAQGQNDLQNLLFLKSASFYQNKKSNNNGVISADNYKRTLAQITHVLLEALGDLKDDDIQLEAGSFSDNNGDDERIKAPPVDNNNQNHSKTILFLASNPSGTGELQLTKEHSRISKELQDSDFKLKMKNAVTWSSFNKNIVQEEPFIIHFSGHGERSDVELKDVMSRGGLDIDDEESTDDTGIVLFSEDMREAFFVSTSAIRLSFKSMINIQKINIETVIFNSCYSEAQAEAIAEFVPNVIGTSWSVKDKAAIAFATNFYAGIAEGKNVLQAVNLGVINAVAYGEPAERFVLYQNGEKVEM